jgi:hypothetical protein
MTHRPSRTIVPSSIWISVYLLRLAAVLTFLAPLLLILWIRDTATRVERDAESIAGVAFSQRQVDGVVTAIRDLAEHYLGQWPGYAVLVLLLLAAAVAVCYVVLARGILRGRRAARRTGTTLAMISTPALLLGPSWWAWVGIGVVGMAAAWVPASNRHFSTAESLSKPGWWEVAGRRLGAASTTGTSSDTPSSTSAGTASNGQSEPGKSARSSIEHANRSVSYGSGTSGLIQRLAHASGNAGRDISEVGGAALSAGRLKLREVQRRDATPAQPQPGGLSEDTATQ